LNCGCFFYRINTKPRMEQELTYPEGIYHYIYRVCFFHWMHILSAFYYEMYLSGWMGITLFVTSLNYWKKPYRKSHSRTIDMICVHLIVPYQYYLSLFTTNKLICTGLMTIGILMYPLSNYYHKQNQPALIKISAFCHCGLHLFLSIGLCFMYKNYYDENITSVYLIR